MTTFLLRGEPLSEIEPDWTEDRLAYISGEWAEELQWRLDQLDDLSNEDYQRLVDADIVSMLAHPWSGWGQESFLWQMNLYIPMPVPVPSTDIWSAVAIQTSPDEWPMLYVLLPHERPSIDVYGYIGAHTPDDAPRTLDSLANNWARMVRYRLCGIEVGYWPDGGDPLLLVEAHRHGHVGGISQFNIPPVPGEVRLRVVRFTVDQSGEKRDGDWTDPIRIDYAYSDADGASVFSDKHYSEYGDDQVFYYNNRGRKWCSSSIGDPYIPMDRAGKADWVGHRMPVTLAARAAAVAERKAKYTAPPALIEQMKVEAHDGFQGHAHMLRWRKALSALDQDDYVHFPPMSSEEAQRWAEGGRPDWRPVAEEIRTREIAFGANKSPIEWPAAPPEAEEPQADEAVVSGAVDAGHTPEAPVQVKPSVRQSVLRTVEGYYEKNQHKDPWYGENWYRVLLAFGESPDWHGDREAPTEPFSSADAREQAQIWNGWTPIAIELERIGQ